MVCANNDSVALTRFGAEAGGDGAVEAQAGAEHHRSTLEDHVHCTARLGTSRQNGPTIGCVARVPTAAHLAPGPFIIAILACEFSPSYLASAADRTGIASVYSVQSGRRTASGQELNREALTAAHRRLPLRTKVKVTNKSNGHSVVVTINDPGPFVRGRIIDVSPAADRALGFSGLTHVTVNGE
jgi:rare lipoprotein A